jgi:hypothetical protein
MVGIDPPQRAAILTPVTGPNVVCASRRSYTRLRLVLSGR